MAANSPFLRPLGIAAGVLGSFQAIIWGVLSLLGILVYAGAIQPELSLFTSDQFKMTLISMYFVPTSTDATIMTPGTVVVWTSIYFATSVIWLVVSGILLYDSYKSKFTSNIIIGWVTVSAVVAAIDFAGTITFGVDFDTVKSLVDGPGVWLLPATESLLAPLFMMIMCARGFILWIINVGLVIYLGVAASKLYKKSSPKLLQEPDKLSRHPPFNSHYYDSPGPNMYASPRGDPPIQGRSNSTFQPDPIYAWDTQAPTAGHQQPSRRDIPPQNPPRVNDVVNPIAPIPRVGKPLATPTALQPTPQPDYSPPMRRPVKHEPYMYEAPTRPVLKNPSVQGRSYF